MHFPYFAFKAVCCLFKDKQEVCLQDILPFYKPSPPLSVRNLLFLFIICHPPFHIIKNAEPFSCTAFIDHLYGIIPKGKFYISLLYSRNAGHAGQQGGFFPIGGSIIKYRMVYFILFQPQFPITYTCGLEIKAVQIYPCCSAARSKIYGQGKRQRCRLPYFKIKQRDSVHLHVLRKRLPQPIVNPIYCLRLPPAHTIQAKVLYIRLSAQDTGFLRQVKYILPFSPGFRIQYGTYRSIPAHHQGICSGQPLFIRNRHLIIKSRCNPFPDNHFRAPSPVRIRLFIQSALFQGFL